MKRFLFILLFLFLTGCGPKQPDNVQSSKIAATHEITQIQIKELFPGKYIVFNDEIYATFNPNYLVGWHNEFLKILDNLGLTSKWRTDFDCDSFAMLKAAVGQTLFPVHTFHDNKNAQNVAIGELWYIIEKSNTGHAINVVIEEEDNKLIVKYVDIYTGHYLNLTEKEIKSIFFVRF